MNLSILSSPKKSPYLGTEPTSISHYCIILSQNNVISMKLPTIYTSTPQTTMFSLFLIYWQKNIKFLQNFNFVVLTFSSRMWCFYWILVLLCHEHFCFEIFGMKNKMCMTVTVTVKNMHVADRYKMHGNKTCDFFEISSWAER